MTTNFFDEPLREIIGQFDGEHMKTPDGKQYIMPGNYVSKSKLVMGDRLKLLIMPDGTFMYKQIQPASRRKLIGVVMDSMQVLAEDKLYAIIDASLTFYRVRPGDKVAIIIPSETDSPWAALDNKITEIDIEY